MIEATSCGGVVIFRGKILLLYKNYKNKYEGWVLPKGTVEQGEEYKDTALREVLEESGAKATIIKYIGTSEYSFTVPEDTVEKEVHWYLMMADSYYSKPQREEFFVDSGFYKYHEAYHLLKFSNEKQILEKAYNEYLERTGGNAYTAEQPDDEIETAIYGVPREMPTGFSREIRTQREIYNMLYFLLDIAAPGLETLTTPQRIWLYGNIVASSGSEMTVPKRLSLKHPTYIQAGLIKSRQWNIAVSWTISFIRSTLLVN